jgi:hypothetical protein
VWQDKQSEQDYVGLFGSFDVASVSLAWLDGKLAVPTKLHNILYSKAV